MCMGYLTQNMGKGIIINKLDQPHYYTVKIEDIILKRNQIYCIVKNRI